MVAIDRKLGAIFLVLVLLEGCSNGALWKVTEISPADHPYYEKERIKALTLDELHFEEIKRTEIDGVEIIIGTYSGFEQSFAMADGTTKTIPWRQGGALFLPSREQMNKEGAGKAVLYNGHFIFTDKIKGFAPTDKSVWGFELNQNWGIGVAKAFGIPVLIHGYEPRVVEDISGTLYHDLQTVMFERLLNLNITEDEDMPLDGRYLINGWPLAKGDMVSISLLQRLVERERGVLIDEVGSLGISKAGASQWIVGAADDRVTVLGPGGSYHEDWPTFLDRYRKDWNADSAAAGIPASMDPLLQSAWRLGDWLVTTDAGRKVDRLISPTHWIDDIHARHILVSGDLGRTSHHDRIWPMLGENQFISKLVRTHESVRYVRAYDGSGVTMGDRVGEMGRSLLPHVADLLVNDAVTPGTPQVNVEQMGRRLRFSSVSVIGDVEHVEAILVYAVSPERTLRRPELEWHFLPMQAAEAQPNRFVSPWLEAIPEEQGITYMVVVREKVQRDPITYWRSAASLPAEHFPLPVFSGQLPSWKFDSRKAN